MSACSLTKAGASVHMQAEARVTLAVVGASSVHTFMLTASVMDLALINICKKQHAQTQLLPKLIVDKNAAQNA